MNVLVTSISSKVPLLKAVKNSIKEIDKNAILIGTDINKECIGSYFVDKMIGLPRIDELKIDDFINKCKKHNIRFIIPTRDGELSYFAKHKADFKNNKISVFVSNSKSIELCTDKLLFYKECLKYNLPCIETSENIDEIEADYLVVKERYGAGSRSMGINLSRDEAKKHSKLLINPIFQPYIKGREFSADSYSDSKGNNKGVILRTRDFVVNGESKITTIAFDEQIRENVETLVNNLKLTYHSVSQILKTEDGKIYFIECNPRFGGASTLSIKAGLNSFYWFFLESLGYDISELKLNSKNNNLKMIRYSEDLFI